MLDGSIIDHHTYRGLQDGYRIFRKRGIVTKVIVFEELNWQDQNLKLATIRKASKFKEISSFICLPPWKGI